LGTKTGTAKEHGIDERFLIEEQKGAPRKQEIIFFLSHAF